ncbi:MAG: ribosome maturation factor RimM [Spirochaetota bacterium]
MAEIAVGRIGKPHGLKGWVRVHSFSGETAHFHNMTEAVLRGDATERRVTVEAVEERPNALLLKFEGVDDADASARLRNLEMWVDRSMAAPRGENEYYVQELVGCDIVHGGRKAGVVRSVWESATLDMLEVELTGGGIRNVPLHREYVGEIDISAGRIDVVYGELLE